MQNDNFWIGFLIGAIVPVGGYILIGEIFNFLSNSGIMDETSISTIGKRERTTLLLAIACNLLALQYFIRLRKKERSIQGLITATFIYAGFWMYRYYEILIRNF